MEVKTTQELKLEDEIETIYARLQEAHTAIGELIILVKALHSLDRSEHSDDWLDEFDEDVQDKIDRWGHLDGA